MKNIVYTLQYVRVKAFPLLLATDNKIVTLGGILPIIDSPIYFLYYPSNPIEVTWIVEDPIYSSF